MALCPGDVEARDLGVVLEPSLSHPMSPSLTVSLSETYLPSIYVCSHHGHHPSHCPLSLDTAGAPTAAPGPPHSAANHHVLSRAPVTAPQETLQWLPRPSLCHGLGSYMSAFRGPHLPQPSLLTPSQTLTPWLAFLSSKNDVLPPSGPAPSWLVPLSKLALWAPHPLIFGVPAPSTPSGD